MKSYPIPAWLANAELGLGFRLTEDKLLDLAYSSESAGRWIDENRVAGNRGNFLIARRALRLFTSVADCSMLVPPCGAILERIRNVTIRLKGLTN